MTAIINGLNFRCNFYGNEHSAKIDVEQSLRLRRQRIAAKESDLSDQVLLRGLCEVKHAAAQTKVRPQKTAGLASCSCWYMFNDFLPLDLQDNIDSDGHGEINIFNKVTINRFISFLKHEKELNKFYDPVSWDMFSNNDSVNRLIFDVSENECADLMDEDKLKKISAEKWIVLKEYFDYFTTLCNDYFLNFLSTLCRKSVPVFNINGYDLALLHSLQAPEQFKANEKRPIVYIIRCKSSMDYLLVPLIFKEAGIDQPVCIVGESPLVLNMRPILSRIGYLIVRKENNLKYPKLQSFIIEKKTSMILEAQKSICLVLNDSLNTNVASFGEKSEAQVLMSVVNAYIDGKLKDPILVPLALCHEFIPKEFISSSLSSWFSNSLMFLRMMSRQFGIVKLSICKPIYYSQCMGTPEGSDNLGHTNQKSKISSLIKHFSWFGTESQLVMPTNLVAFLILYCYKDKRLISVEDMAYTALDLIKDIIPFDVLAFQESPMLTIIRRGCNILSHLLTVTQNPDDKAQFNISFNHEDYSKMIEMDGYADVVVNQILMKAVAATSFTSITLVTPSMQYVNQLTVTFDNMLDGISNLTKLLLSRHFQFLLPCKALDEEISRVNNWWNEAMITSTRATDYMVIENDYNNKDGNNTMNSNQDWRADIYDKRIRSQILLLSSCLAPRLEALSFLVAELMLNKQVGFDTMTLCSELYSKFVESIKTAAKLNRIRFRSCLKPEYFLSALITLNAHEIVKIMDLSTRTWMVLEDDVNLLSSRYAILDSEYYNLHRWKTYIDLALVAV